MPEINTDLFQLLTLAGSPPLWLLVLALMSTVAKLSKAVKALTPGASEAAVSSDAEGTPSAAAEESSDDEFAAAAAGAGSLSATGAVSSSEEAIAATVEPETAGT